MTEQREPNNRTLRVSAGKTLDLGAEVTLDGKRITISLDAIQLLDLARHLAKLGLIGEVICESNPHDSWAYQVTGYGEIASLACDDPRLPDPNKPISAIGGYEPRPPETRPVCPEFWE